MTARPAGCGSCTLCCTLIKVEMEPPKPWRTPCVHCSAKGCEIYADRPEPCQVFKCVWLGSQETPYRLPADLRPDRCGVVMDVNSVGTLLVYSDRPASWKRPAIYPWLLDRAAHVVVLVDDGQSTKLLRKDGRLDELTFLGVDPVTNNRVYAHVQAPA